MIILCRHALFTLRAQCGVFLLKNVYEAEVYVIKICTCFMNEYHF